jgi:hypothetical protein
MENPSLANKANGYPKQTVAKSKQWKVALANKTKFLLNLSVFCFKIGDFKRKGKEKNIYSQI